MKFEVYGPFELSLKDNSRRLAKNVRMSFVEQANQDTDGLSEACGCYVFSIRKKGGPPKPWYIGKTERRTFSKECMIDKNIVMCNDLLDESHGQPELYLLPKMTKTGRFANPTKAEKSQTVTAIDFLETMLIGMGIERNEQLANIGKTKMHGLAVAGFFKSKQRGPRGESAIKLRGVFGLKKK